MAINPLKLNIHKLPLKPPPEKKDPRVVQQQQHDSQVAPKNVNFPKKPPGAVFSVKSEPRTKATFSITFITEDINLFTLSLLLLLSFWWPFQGQTGQYRVFCAWIQQEKEKQPWGLLQVQQNRGILVTQHTGAFWRICNFGIQGFGCVFGDAAMKVVGCEEYRYIILKAATEEEDRQMNTSLAITGGYIWRGKLEDGAIFVLGMKIEWGTRAMRRRQFYSANGFVLVNRAIRNFFSKRRYPHNVALTTYFRLMVSSQKNTTKRFICLLPNYKVHYKLQIFIIFINKCNLYNMQNFTLHHKVPHKVGYATTPILK
ncbi:hypothetical protein LXL04_022601 [Taraxacum kok-saghyz]